MVKKIFKWAAVILLIVLAVLLVRTIMSVIAVIFAASLIAFLLIGPMSFLEKRMHPTLAGIICILLSIVLPALIIAFIVPTISNQLGSLADIFRDIESALERISQKADQFLSPLGMDVDIKGFFLQLLPRGGEDTLGKLISGAANAGQYVVSPVIAFYLLRDRKKLFDVLLRFIPSKIRFDVMRFAKKSAEFFSGYVKGQLLIALFTGSLTALAMAIVGIDAYILLGIMMGILNLIPYFGSVIGMIPIAIVSAPLGIYKMISALIAALLVQQAETLIIAPKILSDTAGFHPCVVIILLLIGAKLFSVWGMILIVPAFTLIKGAYLAILDNKLYQ